MLKSSKRFCITVGVNESKLHQLYSMSYEMQMAKTRRQGFLNPLPTACRLIVLNLLRCLVKIFLTHQSNNAQVFKIEIWLEVYLKQLHMYKL